MGRDSFEMSMNLQQRANSPIRLAWRVHKGIGQEGTWPVPSRSCECFISLCKVGLVRLHVHMSGRE